MKFIQIHAWAYGLLCVMLGIFGSRKKKEENIRKVYPTYTHHYTAVLCYFVLSKMYMMSSEYCSERRCSGWTCEVLIYVCWLVMAFQIICCEKRRLLIYYYSSSFWNNLIQLKLSSFSFERNVCLFFYR